MQFKDISRTLVLSLLAIGFLAVSCISVDKSLGSQFIPDDEKLQVHTVTFPLPLELRMADSLQAQSSSTALLGAFRSTELGEIHFGTAANISPVLGGTIKFGKDPVIKSIYFVTAISETQVLEESQSGIPQNIEVYRMMKVIDTTTLYNNSIRPGDYDPVPLNTGSATFFGGDSIKIYLSNDYGALLLTATDKELDSLDLFIKKFKGLYLTASAPEQGLTGGRLNLFSAPDASLVISYNFQPEWKAGLPRKDTTVVLAFAGDGYCLNTSSYGSQHLETANTSDMTVLPVEGAAGIKPYISMDALKTMLDDWMEKNNYDPKKILLIKGEYVLPYEMPADYKQLDRYPLSLYPTYHQKESSTGRMYYYQPTDIYTADNPAGNIDRSAMVYKGDFSSTLQKMISKTRQELASDTQFAYDFWFMPSTRTTDIYGNVTFNIEYTYYNGKINGPKAERYPTLNIVYTVL